MLQPRIELGPKRWQRSILPLNYCSLTVHFHINIHMYAIIFTFFLLSFCFMETNKFYLTNSFYVKIKIKKYQNSSLMLSCESESSSP